MLGAARNMTSDYPILEFDGTSKAIIEPSEVLKPVEGLPRAVCSSHLPHRD
jgi:hypothetical protein